uniref:Uncharacterized protein n=1 Tax=Anopheles albimanus TaxID=7167 RepID=A0A182FXK1_ANOAL
RPLSFFSQHSGTGIGRTFTKLHEANTEIPKRERTSSVARMKTRPPDGVLSELRVAVPEYINYQKFEWLSLQPSTKNSLDVRY